MYYFYGAGASILTHRDARPADVRQVSRVELGCGHAHVGRERLRHGEEVELMLVLLAGGGRFDATSCTSSIAFALVHFVGDGSSFSFSSCSLSSSSWKLKGFRKETIGLDILLKL